MILRSGMIVDPVNHVHEKSDIEFQDGKIIRVGQELQGTEEIDVDGMWVFPGIIDSHLHLYPAEKEIDASGKIISPGFIDVHSHSDMHAFINNRMESKLCQGITTEIVGNCGMSVIPVDLNRIREFQEEVADDLSVEHAMMKREIVDIDTYAAEFDKTNAYVNIASLIGHGTLRRAVMGMEYREPDNKEMDRMKYLLDTLLKTGAVGMSIGLVYAPSSFASTKELIELAKVIKTNDRIMTAHIRNENTEIFKAVDEMIDIARITGVHMHISHLKLMGMKQWGKAQVIIDKINNARKEGLTITADQYPYDASSTSLGVLIPKWAHEGGFENLCSRLADPVLAAQIKEGIENEAAARGGSDRISVAFTNNQFKEIENNTLKQVADMWGMTTADTVIRIYVKSQGVTRAIYHSISNEDVIRIMKEHYISIGTDGSAYSLDRSITKGNPHCRAFGTFPKYIELVKENKLFSVSEMVRKITGLAADTFGINSRGYIREGYQADITIFDPDRIKDVSRYEDSVKKPEGIDYVFVNGKLEIERGNIVDNINNGAGKFICI